MPEPQTILLDLQHAESTFAKAELDDTDAMLTINTETESLTLEGSIDQGELCAKLSSGERELFDGPASDLEDIFEIYGAVSGLKGNQGVIKALETEKEHPDVDALLKYLKRTY